VTKILTFKTGDLAAAVSRAARIAPNKGAAFDRAAGMMLETDDDGDLIVRSTNVEVSYRETVTPITAPTGAVRWRVPAALVDGVLSSMDPATEVTLTEDGPAVKMKAGRKKALLRRMDEGLFPAWNDFDGTTMGEVPDLAKRLKQASWACDASAIPFAGVHITGKSIIATDRYKLVNVPCEVPVDNPITVPMSLVAPLISDTALMRIRSEERRLLLMPNERTKITTVIFCTKYPTEDQLKGVMREDFSITTKVDRLALLEALSDMAVLVKTERYPTTKFTFSRKSLHLYMNVKETGEMEDFLEIEAELPDNMESFEIYFTPSFFIQGLAATSADVVTLKVGPEQTKTALIEGDHEYRAWIMPRKV
jgi:DNA polymerase III sliding clamp (beta) subunit (PCNA family)